MTTGATILLLDPSQISLKREARQRTRLTSMEELTNSIKTVGQIQPIVISRSPDGYELIAGERRLTACKALGVHVFCVLRELLSPYELQLLELEENVQREELPWPDRAKATAKLYSLLKEHTPALTRDEACARIGVKNTTLTEAVALAGALAVDPKLAEVSGWKTAYNVVSRQVARKADIEMESILGDARAFTQGAGLPPAEGLSSELDPANWDEDSIQVSPLGAPVQVPAKADLILCGDFVTWVKSYSGPRFNLIHCDFPYGVNHDKSDQGNTEAWGGYDDSPEIYYTLVAKFLQNQDNFVASAAHCLFWFSMKYYQWTLEQFSRSGWVVNPTPLIWFKSDNTGILPDYSRGPRQVYETALLMSRGDRKIVKAVGNCFPHPGRKSDMIHVSQKPEEMLSHFLSMLVDSSTEFLDPTCGGGSALRVAYRLGASRIQGLELNPEFAAHANSVLNQIRS